MSRLRGTGALARAWLAEAWRAKPALFWNLAFPLVFMIGLGYIFGGGDPEQVARIVPGILTINLIAAAFFGLSLHMVAVRDQGLYRRLRATPVSAAAIVLSHAATSAVNIVVAVALQLAVATALFDLEIRGSIAELGLAVLLGAFAFIPLGLLVGSVARDMRSAPVLSNLLFFPMMFLSGAALPLFLMPPWLQRAAALLPATYVVEALQGAILRADGLDGLAVPALVLVTTGLVAFAFDAALFRWEVDQPLDRRRLAAAAAALAAVYVALYLALLGGRFELEAARGPERGAADLERGAGGGGPDAAARERDHRRVLEGLTVLDGTGRRIEGARIVIDGERVTAVGPAEGAPPAGAEVTDLTGLYAVPGLIDSHVHLGGSAGGSASSGEFMPARVIRDLQVYLALGVTSVVSMTDDPDDLRRLRAAVADGSMRAPRPYFSGPGLTAPGGHPARFFVFVPGLADRMTRQVDDPGEAEEVVRGLADLDVDLIKLYLESGWIGDSFPVLPELALRAAVAEARRLGLPAAVHVGSDRDARMAVDAGAAAIEHVPPDLSDETIRRMAERGVTLTPTLAAFEGLARAAAGEPVTDPLARRWVAPNVVDSLRSPESWLARVRDSPEAVAYYVERHRRARDSLRRAVAGGVTVIAGSDAGNPGAFHGPGLIRELELLVEAGGMAPGAALAAATGAAAERLGTGEIGRIAPGAFADLVILGADPEADPGALRDVRAVYFGGRPLDRESLLKTSPGSWMPGRPPGI